jgi:hypothetical protein
VLNYESSRTITSIVAYGTQERTQFCTIQSGAKEPTDLRSVLSPSGEDGKTLPGIERIAADDLVESLVKIKGEPPADWKPGKQVTTIACVFPHQSQDSSISLAPSACYQGVVFQSGALNN